MRELQKPRKWAHYSTELLDFIESIVNRRVDTNAIYKLQILKAPRSLAPGLMRRATWRPRFTAKWREKQGS